MNKRYYKIFYKESMSNAFARLSIAVKNTKKASDKIVCFKSNKNTGLVDILAVYDHTGLLIRKF